MNSWEITIPGRPVPKARPRVCKNGHTYTTESTKTAETTAQWYIKAVLGDIKITEPLCIGIWFSFKHKIKEDVPYDKRPDLDNLIKLIMDALMPWISDDAIITEIWAQKSYTDQDSTWIELRVIK